METRNSLSILTCIGLVTLHAVVRPAAGIIIARPIEYSLTHAHVIVVGKVVEMTPDIKVKRGSGSNSSMDYYRLGYVQVEEVLKNDLAHFTVEPGDRVEIELGPTAKRAEALAKERAKDQRFITSESGPYHPMEKGDGGIWLLYLSSPGQRHTFMLSSLMEMEMLDKIRDKLDKLERAYQDALKNEIPRYAEQRERFLSTPALTQEKADAAMGKAIAPEVDLSEVCVVNYGNTQALFVTNGGQIVGGVPYHASDSIFRERYVPVATVLDHGYSRYNYVDRSGKLLCSRFYSYAEPFSEGRALVGNDRRLAGFIDVEGKEVILCWFSGNWTSPMVGPATRLLD